MSKSKSTIQKISRKILTTIKLHITLLKIFSSHRQWVDWISFPQQAIFYIYYYCCCAQSLNLLSEKMLFSLSTRSISNICSENCDVSVFRIKYNMAGWNSPLLLYQHFLLLLLCYGYTIAENPSSKSSDSTKRSEMKFLSAVQILVYWCRDVDVSNIWKMVYKVHCTPLIYTTLRWDRNR